MTDSIETLLQPGESSGSGFLGRGESFEEVVKNDSQTLTELGLQHRDIAQRLQYFIDKSSSGEGIKKGDRIIINDKYKLRAVGWLGYQNCPWQDEEKTDMDYFIENTETGRRISFSGLMPHLVADHQFFEGRGARYRLGPLETILVLDIATPNATIADVEGRLFRELTSDLESEYIDARKHALETLSWFKEREDLPQYVSKFIQNLRESANDENSSSEFWDYVKLLINLGSTLSEESERHVNPQIYGLLDVLNENNDICGFVKRDLMRFKREVEGTTHPNLIKGFYWQDYIALRLEHTSADQVQTSVDYVERNNITVDGVAERGTEHWVAYLGVDSLARIGQRNICPRESFKDKVQNKIFSPYDRGGFFLDKMREKVPYLNGADESSKSLQKRLHFFEVASDVAALQITPLKFKEYLGERAKILDLLGRSSEATEFRELSYRA